jgi:hypothetical protein
MTSADSISAPPPLSRLARLTAGASLVLAGLSNGLSQYLTAALTDANDGETFSDQIRWGVDHPVVHQTEQALLLASSLLLPIGVLGLAQVSRWRAPRITAVATALALWGLWGFHTVIALGYAAGSIAPGVIGVDPAVALNDGFGGHSGSVAFALLPHLVGSFLGLLLLVLACWRARSCPRTPLVLLSAFLIWDFMLPAYGALEPHLLLFVALAWLGVHMVLMGDEAWQGSVGARRRRLEPILSR